MNGVMSYIDDLMRNHPLESENVYTESSEELMFGGKMDEQVGFGGFPPIYVCEKGDSTESPFEEEVKVKREFSKPKTSVSIANIMEERRNIKPFITLS